MESLGNLCGRCRETANRKGRMGLRQEGRGQKKKGEGAQPSFALGGTVSSTGENTFLSFFFRPPSTSDLRSLFVWGQSSTWPHDPVTPSSSLRGPGELPAEGAASSREAVGPNTTRRNHHAAGGLSCRAGLLDRDRRGRRRRGGKWNVHVGLCSRNGCRGSNL